jgi:hypothetical protein
MLQASFTTKDQFNANRLESRAFVIGLCQFRTRYCGHTLSRLTEIRHNRTKQCGFPPIRRKSLKSRNAISGLVELLDFNRTEQAKVLYTELA